MFACFRRWNPDYTRQLCFRATLAPGRANNPDAALPPRLAANAASVTDVPGRPDYSPVGRHRFAALQHLWFAHQANVAGEIDVFTAFQFNPQAFNAVQSPFSSILRRSMLSNLGSSMFAVLILKLATRIRTHSPRVCVRIISILIVITFPPSVLSTSMEIVSPSKVVITDRAPHCPPLSTNSPLSGLLSLLVVMLNTPFQVVSLMEMPTMIGLMVLQLEWSLASSKSLPRLRLSIVVLVSLIRTF